MWGMRERGKKRERKQEKQEEGKGERERASGTVRQGALTCVHPRHELQRYRDRDERPEDVDILGGRAR